jgi:hypothetical protein
MKPLGWLRQKEMMQEKLKILASSQFLYLSSLLPHTHRLSSWTHLVTTGTTRRSNPKDHHHALQQLDLLRSTQAKTYIDRKGKREKREPTKGRET